MVEAARKSGSLITAQMALDFGREVFAVPGQADSFKSEGTHWLIRQGAQLVIHGDDILSELGVAAGQGSGAKGNKGQRVLSGLDPDAVALLNQLDPYPVTRDELGQQAGMTASRISELLLYLELEGCVELLSGDRIQKIVE